MSQKYAGIDIGGTTVKLGIFGEDGTLLHKWEIPTRTENAGVNILPDIAASIREKQKELGIEELAGAGMGLPGPVQPDGHVAFCVNLGWKDLNPEKILSGLLGGIPVKSSNDCNVAALGELWQGGGKGYRNLVMVTLGTGVGGGIILDGKIWNGTMGVGGEIGHMHVVDDETEHCNCGGCGCLEQVSSATGIARLARRKLAADQRDSSLRGIEPLTAKEVLDEAKKGDTIALEVVEQACSYLGTAFANITMVVDPQAYLIGGGVSKAGTFLTEKIQKYYDKMSLMSVQKARVLLATLGNDAGIYGAAKLVLG